LRIQVASDLHLERYPDFTPQAAPDADVLVLAGDIGSYQPGSLLPLDDFALTRFSPKLPGAPWRRVLFVPGNHEYDSLDQAATRVRLQALCAELGITWLDREVVVIDGVRFLGTTLWSDFEALAATERTETKRQQALQKAFRAANFYLRKNTTRRDDQPMLAEDLREEGLACQRWLREALSQPHDGATVVVTHFAPTLHSADPRYGLVPGTAGFCNGLDDLLPQADLWVHGHLHCPVDHTVRGRTGADAHPERDWACRIVANPRGYFSKGEQAGFREGHVVSVPRGHRNALNQEQRAEPA
jgi:predicted phosphodiesterase